MEDQRIVVDGTASRTVPPDRATLSVRVREIDADQRVAFERCVPRMNELVGRLTEQLGSDGRVTADVVRVHRDWDDFAEERQRVLHVASASITVECAPEVAANVVTNAVALGAD